MKLIEKTENPLNRGDPAGQKTAKTLLTHKGIVMGTALVAGLGAIALAYPVLRDEAYWFQTAHQDVPSAYLNYQKALPKGRHLTEAKALYEERVWQEVTAANTIEGYKKYSQEQPTGKYIAQAQEKLEGLYWDRAQTVNTVESYRQYLNRYPSGQRVNLAQEKVRTLSPLSSNDIFALNVRASQQDSGIKVDVLRVLVGRKSVIKEHPQLHNRDLLITSPIRYPESRSLKDNDVISAVTLRVKNNTNKPIAFINSQWVVSTGGKQMKPIAIDLNGIDKILPGVTSDFVVWFNLEDVSISSIQSMSISLGSAHEEKPMQGYGTVYYPVTSDFFFQVDLSKHIFEPFPKELVSQKNEDAAILRLWATGLTAILTKLMKCVIS